MRFSRIYVSAVVEHDGDCQTFDDLDNVGPDTIARFEDLFGIKIYWSIYGVEGVDGFLGVTPNEPYLSTCIGNFKTRAYAEEVAGALRAGIV